MSLLKFHRISLLTCTLLVAASGAAAQEILTPEEAIDRALEANYSVRMARNSAEIAANNRSLGNAGFLPTLQLNARGNTAVTDTRQTFVGSDPRELSNASSTSANADALLRWTLFDGLGRFAAHDRLRAEQRREAYYVEGTVEDMLADVLIAYYDIVRQRQELHVRREALDISRQRLQIARSRFELGSASELDVRRAEVAMNTDSAAVVREQMTLYTAKEHLTGLLAQSVSVPFTVIDTIAVDTSLSIDRLARTSRQQNPVVQQARQEETVAELTRREIQAERFPTIQLNTGYSFTNLTSESGFMERNRSYEFAYGFTVAFDLFDGLDRRRRLQNADIRAQNARLAIDDINSQVQTNLRTQFRQYNSSLRLMALERSSITAARENVEIALEQFELGTITSVELRDVQEALVAAEGRLITAKFQAKQAETELLRLAGQLSAEVASQ